MSERRELPNEARSSVFAHSSSFERIRKCAGHSRQRGWRTWPNVMNNGLMRKYTFGLLRYLYFIIGLNIKKKSWFPVFYASRDLIRNWLQLYCISSSLVVDLLLAMYSRQKHGETLKIKVNYRNKMVLYFPLLNSRYYGMFVDMVADQYIGEYFKYYGEEIVLNENDIVIDIGAHVGKFSIPMALRYPKIHTYAVEPDPDNYSCLRLNYEANKINISKYSIYNGVVADNKEEKEFSIGNFSTMGSITKLDFNYKNPHANTIRIRSYTLEEIFRENAIRCCALLKIDCEGSEYLIFESLPAEIYKKLEIIFIEVHLVKGKQPFMIKDTLENNGFIVKGHERSDGAWEMYCVNTVRRRT